MSTEIRGRSQKPGAKLLLTANIHGNEVNPCIIIHRVLAWLETAVANGELRGTVALYPSLNPTGHRAGTRSPSFQSVDPNRFWPDTFSKPDTFVGPYDAAQAEALGELADDQYAELYAASNLRGPVETCWATLFEVWKQAEFDYHCDLHTAMTLSVPFVCALAAPARACCAL